MQKWFQMRNVQQQIVGTAAGCIAILLRNDCMMATKKAKTQETMNEI